MCYLHLVKCKYVQFVVTLYHNFAMLRIIPINTTSSVASKYAPEYLSDLRSRIIPAVKLCHSRIVCYSFYKIFSQFNAICPFLYSPQNVAKTFWSMSFLLARMEESLIYNAQDFPRGLPISSISFPSLPSFMLLGLAVTSWLLVTGVDGTLLPKSKPTRGARTINHPAEYLRYAKEHGLCHPKRGEKENLGRTLVVPGPRVLANFEECIAKNEFGETLQDHSGDIFCQGLAIHLMADAMNHKDSKEFVDRASKMDGSKFNNELNHLIGNTLSDDFTVKKFLDEINKNYELFKPGAELHLYNNTRFPNTPAFIAQIRPQARLLRGWSKIVHHYWNNLDRTMRQMYSGYLIPGPGSTPPDKGKTIQEKYSTSLIRLEHPFVVAGGRFREQYYWDSFFIMEGLLVANMSYLARTTILNFMDQIKAYGFIPNGGRKYYLNRSQPPLFIPMLHAYVEATGDFQILHEALPLAQREMKWWYKHRTVYIKHGNKKYFVFRHYAQATGPRPESYAEDWRSVWCHSDEPPIPAKAKMFYSEFASGAETGWDYTARWMSDPYERVHESKTEQMRHLRMEKTIPVDLNSIMYRNHKLMAHLYRKASNEESPFATTYSQRHEGAAKQLRAAILALHWDSTNLAFFDYVLEDKVPGEDRTGSINRFWSGASMVPYWAEVWPDSLDCATKESKNMVMGMFSGVRDILEMYPGPLPATLLETKQQWDFPNSWPPLQYFAIKALQNVNETCIIGTNTTTFRETKRPSEQLGERPPPEAIPNTPEVDYSSSPSWRDVLLKTVSMRYINAAYCTWNNKGQLPSDRIEILMRDNPVLDKTLRDHPGEMFEKLNAKSPVSAGGGGEYEVQTGFGWTNGVAIWIAHQFGAILDNPNCVDSTTSKPKPEAASPLVFQN
nr:trehalase-3 [Ceratobasidium cereale]